MSEKKITPKVVKIIETALEERKTRRDRRENPGNAHAYNGSDRRSGKDRRDLEGN